MVTRMQKNENNTCYNSGLHEYPDMYEEYLDSQRTDS